MDSIGKRATHLTVARYVVFLVLLCLYLRYRITPVIDFEAHPHSPVFYSNVSYLRGFLGYPGGLVQYVSGFIGLAYHWPWGGPVVLTLMVGLVCWATDVLIIAMGGRLRGLAFGPALILLVAFNCLMDQPTALTALLAALLSVVLYLGLAGGSDGRRIGVFLLVGVLLHFVAGGSFLLFALVVGLYELLVRRRRLPALVSLLSMEAIPYLGATYVYEVSLLDAFRRWLPWDPAIGPRYPLAACFLYFPALVLGSAAWGWVSSWRARAMEKARGKAPGRKRRADAAQSDDGAAGPGIGRRATRRFAAESLAILAIGVAAAILTFETGVHRVLVVDDCAHRGDWEGVLREAEGLPLLYYTDVVNQHVNRALYETGRMGEAMFAYPQVADWLLVDRALGTTADEQTARMHRRADLWFQIGDLDLRLGLVNEAEHEAHEALAIHGPHPEILKRLALVNLVKRQSDAARVFLNALSDSPVYRAEADGLLRRMASDPYVSDDPYVEHVRAVQFGRAHPLPNSEFHLRCRALLEDNPRNRMAFEYFMASCLLRKDLAALVQELPRLRTLGYVKLPRHYQEAILLHERATMATVDRGGYAISPEVLQSLADFSQAGHGDPAAVAQRFGGTYFFYFAYGVTGSMVPR